MDKIGISSCLNSNYSYCSKNSFELIIENNFDIEKIDSLSINVEDILTDFSENGIFLTIFFDLKVNLFFLKDKTFHSLKEKNIFMHEIESNNFNSKFKKNISIYDMQLEILDNNSILIKVYFFITINDENNNYAAFISKLKNKFILSITNNFFEKSKRIVLCDAKNYKNIKYYKNIYNIIYSKTTFGNIDILCFFDLIKKKEVILSKNFTSIFSFKFSNSSIIVKGVKDGKYGLFIINKNNKNSSDLYINNFINDFIFINKNTLVIVLKKNNVFEFKFLNFISKEVSTFLKLKTSSLCLVENEKIFFFLENNVIKFSTFEINKVFSIASDEKFLRLLKVLKINDELFLILSKTLLGESFLFIYSIKNREKYLLFKKFIELNNLKLDYKKEVVYFTIKKEKNTILFKIDLLNYKITKVFSSNDPHFNLVIY